MTVSKYQVLVVVCVLFPNPCPIWWKHLSNFYGIASYRILFLTVCNAEIYCMWLQVPCGHRGFVCGRRQMSHTRPRSARLPPPCRQAAKWREGKTVALSRHKHKVVLDPYCKLFFVKKAIFANISLLSLKFSTNFQLSCIFSFRTT